MRDVYFGPEEEKLNGVLISAERAGAPAAVICHPHPQFGGSMNNNVVLGIETALSDADFTTLRFDFRGVGRSRGAFGGGEGEQDDVRRAVEFLASDAATGRIFVVGYSFGATVGLLAGMADSRIAALAGIAPPTAMDSFAFLSEMRKPMMLIAGSQDEFCAPDTLKQYIRPESGKLEIVPGADHFFLGHEQRIGELVRDFFREAASKSDG